MMSPELDSLVKDPKCSKDLSEQAGVVLAEAETLKNAGRIKDALDNIMSFEKLARNAADGISVSRVCIWMLSVYADSKNWKELCENFVAFSKKRSQLKRVITDIVQHVVKYLDQLSDEDASTYDVIEALCTVTEGKVRCLSVCVSVFQIFVEVERARVIMRLAMIKEKQGKIDEAAALLQEVQVETSISMDRLEKTRFILEQMRLVLTKGDLIRCQIISKRLSRKILDAEDMQMEKLTFYSYMTLYYVNQNEVLMVGESLKACLDTPIIRNLRSSEIQMCALSKFLPGDLTNPDSLPLWYIQGVIIFTLLAPECPEQIDFLNRIQRDEKKSLIKPFSDMLESFLTQDIIRFPPPYLEEVLKHPILASDKPFPNCAARVLQLRQRMIQHVRFKKS